MMETIINYYFDSQSYSILLKIW